MMKLITRAGCAILALSAAAFPLDRVLGTEPDQGIPNCTEGMGWFTLFDGTQASIDKYWWLPTGQAHGTGGKWTVENGILYSDQVSGQGGVLFTKRQYKNVETKVSVKPNWGNDGGIFMRSNSYGKSYQVVLDYKDGKNLGGIWGESGLHTINYKAFAFDGAGDKITATNLWVDPTKATEWATKIWKKDDFNMVHARIFKNDPPWIESWINGYQMIHYEDTKVESDNLTGHVGLQIHKGTDAWRAGFPNQYKSVYIRSVDVEGKPLTSYPEWSALCTTSKGLRIADPGAMLQWRMNDNHLSISGTADNDFVISVTNIAGKIVSSTRGSAGPYSWNAGTLRPGLHFLAIRSGSITRTVKLLRADG